VGVEGVDVRKSNNTVSVGVGVAVTGRGVNDGVGVKVGGGRAAAVSDAAACAVRAIMVFNPGIGVDAGKNGSQAIRITGMSNKNTTQTFCCDILSP
jgi:hypothetical protein